MNMHGRGGRGGWNSPAFQQSGFSGMPMGRGFQHHGGGWRGGGNRPFGRGFGGPGHQGFGGPDFGGMNAWSCDQDAPEGLMMLSPQEVLRWLDAQNPAILRRVMYHCRWVLEQQGESVDSVGFSDLMNEGFFNEDATPVPPDAGGSNAPAPLPDDMSGWYASEASQVHSGESKGALHNIRGGKVAKNGGRGGQTNFQRGGNLQTAMQWTPGGWAPKDNSHKVTTTIRPLPEPEVIPPVGKKSEEYPEADADRNKLKMLDSNVKMMDFEVKKICKRHGIANLDRENLDNYPEDAKPRLKTAIQCVTAAEKTLNDFKDFLKEEKYKDWNDEQSKKHEESLKSMIGDMPTGTPHKKPSE